VSTGRPRWRAYLLLARVSNVPTVWSNVLAGIVVAGVEPDTGMYVHMAGAVTAFYIGGMFLNDAFDAEFDARQRPERPIPAGDVTRGEAFAVGSALLATALLWLPRQRATLLLGLVLTAAIVFYDYRHKGVLLAPVVMGVCRGLVYCIAASAVAAVSVAVLLAAAVMTVYVVSLTVIARSAGAHARWLVPVLIAAISLVDAAVISLFAGAGVLALVAGAGFPLTLLLQRVVPGD
jgi:4-hydroxybenzoate polyprenyltransferase